MVDWVEVFVFMGFCGLERDRDLVGLFLGMFRVRMGFLGYGVEEGVLVWF